MMGIAEQAGADVVKLARREQLRHEPPAGRFEDEHDADETLAPAASSSKSPSWPVLDVTGIFAQLEPINYLIAPLDLCAGAPALVAGYGFSGKTVALQGAALAVAAGQQAWGAFSARQGRVLHLDYEQGARLTRERYQRLAAGMLLTPQELEGRLELVSMPRVYLDGDNAESFLADKLQGFDLAIVDSLRASCPTLEENSSDVRSALDMLNRVSDRTGCAVVVVHHARKPGPDKAGGARASIRGSGAIFDACGSVLVFEAEKGEPVRVSHEKARVSGRLADDFLLHIEDMEIGENARGGLRVTAESITETKSEQQANRAVDEMKVKILGHLREHGDQPGKTAMRQRMSVNRTVFFAAMAELEKEGLVADVGTARKPLLRLHEASE